VPDARILKLLLVEDSLEDERLISEALIEIGERWLWLAWHSAGIVPVDNLADSLDCLALDSFDAVLLNLSLADSPTLLHSFLEVRAVARGAPIIVLADETDEAFAAFLLREGAQDVLVKSEIECVPLARAIRYAIERERRARCARAELVSELRAAKTAMLAD
jgi:DNA-binding response OmpR family regulator